MPLLFVPILAVVLYSFTVQYYSIGNEKKIFARYQGKYGFYGQYLTLMDNGRFFYSYYGCSKNFGNQIGTWYLIADSLYLINTADHFNNRYQHARSGDFLIQHLNGDTLWLKR